MPSPYKASRTLAVHACIAALVLCIGIGLTLAVVFVYRNAEHTKAVNQFQIVASTTFDNIQTDFATMISHLESLASFMSCQMSESGPQSRAQFAWFGEDILQATASVSVLGYLPLVNDTGRAAYEAKFGSIWDITANGTLVPAPARPLYFPALFTLPNVTPPGGSVDIYQLPGRRQLFDRVLASRSPHISPIFPVLVNISTNRYVNGANLAVPVFEYSDSGVRGPVIGLTTLLLSVADIVATTLPIRGSTLTYTLTDVTSSPATLFNTSYPDCAVEADCSSVTWAANFTFAGRTWLYTATARTSFLNSERTSLPWVFLAVGVLCTIVMLCFVATLVRVEKQAALNASALAAAQAHHWLLTYVCHEVKNPLHGANESVTRIRDMILHGLEGDTVSAGVTVTSEAHAPPSAVITEARDFLVSHGYGHLLDPSAPLAAVFPAVAEEKMMLRLFLRHILRAVDDAVLCEKLTTGRETHTSPQLTTSPCNLSDALMGIVHKMAPFLPGSVTLSLRLVQPSPPDLSCRVAVSTLLSVMEYGLLHAARQTSRGFVTVDYSVSDDVKKDGKHAHDAMLVIDIVFSGSYPAETVDVMMRHGLSLKALVEAGGPANVSSTATDSDSEYCRCRGSCFAKGSHNDSAASIHEATAFPSNEYYTPATTLITVVTSPPDNVCIDAGTKLCLPICDEFMRQLGGSVSLHPVMATGVEGGSPVPAYQLHIMVPVDRCEAVASAVESGGYPGRQLRQIESVLASDFKGKAVAADENGSLHVARALPVLPLAEAIVGEPQVLQVVVTPNSVPDSAGRAAKPLHTVSTATASSTGSGSASDSVALEVKPQAEEGPPVITPLTAFPTGIDVPPLLPFHSIIIVDDEAANRRIAERMCQRLKKGGGPVTADATILCLNDGVELMGAIEALQPQQMPTLILLDIWMPHSNGVSVCGEVRARGLSMPVFAMTAHAEAESIVKYRSTGFNGVLAKPFTAAHLTALVTAAAQVPPPAWIPPATLL